MALLACKSTSKHDPPVHAAPSASQTAENARAARPSTLLWVGAIDDERDVLSLHRAIGGWLNQLPLAQQFEALHLSLDGPHDPSPPIPAVVKLAGTSDELFLGRVDEPGRDGRVRVGGFRSRDASPAWLSTRLDLLSEKPSGIVMRLEAGILVVTTADKHVVLLDPTTGEPLATRVLEAKAVRICGPEPGTVRIDEVVGKSVDIKLKDRSFTTSKSTCDADELDALLKGAKGPRPVSKGPLPEGYTDLRELDEGGVRLALGKMGNEMRLMGIDQAPRSRDPLWLATVGAGELAVFDWHPLFWSDGTEVITEFQRAVPGTRRGELDSTGTHVLCAFDAKTGRELWRTSPEKNAGSPLGFVVTTTHVYVARGSQLDVFDRGGKYAGYVGWH